MIHLIAIQTNPGVWKITTTEMQHKYLGNPEKCGCALCQSKIERPDKLIKKMRESGREWVDGSWRREGEDNDATK